MATTVEFPFELDIVNPTNPNFGWINQNGPFWYSGRYRFQKFANPAMPSGEGISSWKTNIPKNIAGTPNWNIVLHHVNASGSAGAVLIHIAASVLGSGDTPVAQTVLEPNTLLGVRTSGDMNISVLSASSYDSLVPLTAGKFLQIVMRREPLNTSGDSLTGGWDLLIPPLMRVDVV